jgi:hypothetical protein
MKPQPKEGCQKCGKPPASNLKHLGPFCKDCYLGMVERRIRRDLREAKPFPPRSRIHLLTDGALESAVAERLLASILTDIPVTLTTGPKPPKDAILLLPFCLEEDAEGFLADWLLPGSAPGAAARPPGFAFLRSITRDETAEYARLANIAGELRQPTAIGKLFEQFAQEHPEIKFGLQRSKRALDKVLAGEESDKEE